MNIKIQNQHLSEIKSFYKNIYILYCTFLASCCHGFLYIVMFPSVWLKKPHNVMHKQNVIYPA